MATTVFILGAGASKQAGVPLMMEFLDSAYSLWKTGNVSESDKQFSEVFRGIGELQRVHSKSQLDIQNVESVFSAFEMAKTLRKFGGYKSEEIDSLIGSMKTVIVKTIEKTLNLPVISQAVSPPVPYEPFAEMISRLRSEASPKQNIAIITFNYDLALDYTFYYKGIGVDYGFGGTPSESSIPLLKLHGSINWAQCQKCQTVVPWELKDYLQTHKWNLWMTSDVKAVELRTGSHISSFKHCGLPALSEPFVVPPTGNKTGHYEVLTDVWARAAKELTDAENIYVMGYSLPPTDDFFRYLYALGTVGDVILKRFWVFNPDGSGSVMDRFKKILGPGAQQRFSYQQIPFQDSISKIPI